MVLQTARLCLRPWQAQDEDSFIALNADTQVMQYFPSPLSEQESRVFLGQIQAKMAKEGFGLWACALNDTQEVIGFVGLNRPSDTFFFSPCIEISWRIHTRFQKQGLAQEAARMVLRHAFLDLGLDEIVAFTTTMNHGSERLMQRLGMQKYPRHFLHPRLEPTHHLAEHILYTLNRDDWAYADN